MNRYLILVLALCLLFAANFYSWYSKQSGVNIQSWQPVVEYAQAHLPMEGRLTQKSDGFVYLKVDDDYIHTLYPMLGLKEERFHEPDYFRTKNSPGAHVTVFYVEDHVKPEEIGQIFHLYPKLIKIVKTSKRMSYAILEVESPELERLREKYGLSPKIHGHEFHITLAQKRHR